MTDIQAWLDQVSARLEAVKKEPAQEDREREADSAAWSNLYQHAPGDLTNAIDALQAVLDMHNDSSDGGCNECSDGFLVNHPRPTVETIQDALGEQR